MSNALKREPFQPSKGQHKLIARVVPTFWKYDSSHQILVIKIKWVIIFNCFACLMNIVFDYQYS